MRLTKAFGIGLLCFSGSLSAQDRDADLIRFVRELPMGALDSSYKDRDIHLERYFAGRARVAIPSIEWRVNDCGEGDNSAETSICVEGRARTAPDITMIVAVKVADRAAQPTAVGWHRLSVAQRSVTSSADSLQEFENLARRAMPPLTEPAPASAGGITAIMLERTWCYGTCPIDKVELRADGSAVYAGKQHTPRTGFFSGTIRTQAFNELAHWLTAQGFFELRGSYGTPNPDTPFGLLRVTRDGDETWVVNHYLGRNLDVLGMERVIGAVAEEIAWEPMQSRIIGGAARRAPGEPWRPMSMAAFTVYVPDEEHGFVVQTDDAGRFELPLLPGSYRIETILSTPSPSGITRSRPSQTLTVRPGEVTEVQYHFDVETRSAEFAVGAAAGR